MNNKRVNKIVALIGSQPVFPFEVRDIEEDLPLILAYYGIGDELSLPEEFAVQEALIAMASPPSADATIVVETSEAPP